MESEVSDWIIPLAREWGHEMRAFKAKLGNIQGTLGRIRDEGPDGAAIRGQGDYIPDIDFPLQVQQFHKAWLDLDYHLNKIIRIDYIERGPAPKKWAKMDMSRSEYYKYRRKALVSIQNELPFYE